MKRTLAALILCITFSMQIFASNDVIVDHNNKTVTVVANFISSSPITKSMNKAAELWNSKSGKYHCEMLVNGQKMDYAIHFKLVVNQNPLSDTALNVIAVLPDYHPFFALKTSVNANGDELSERAVSVTDGRTIGISTFYRNNKYVLAHEMGHALGLCHKAGGKCCYFSEKEVAMFEVEQSVTDLAVLVNKKHKSTRKFVELGSNSVDYVAEM